MTQQIYNGKGDVGCMITVDQFATKLAELQIELVAGQYGQNKSINYINIQEFPLQSDRIQRHGFIMTTLAAFRDDNEIVKHVHWLLTREIAALAIHTVVWEEIPQAVITIGNEYDLPIFLIPPHVSYHEILKTHNNLLLRENDELRLQIEKMNLNLLEAVAQDKGASYIIATIGKYIESPILFFDNNINLISIWTDRLINRDKFSLRVKSILEVGLELLQQEKFSKVERLLESEISSFPKFTIYPITDKLDKHGYLVIALSEKQNLLVNSAVKYGKTALLIDAVKRKSLDKFLKNQEIRLLESIMEGKTRSNTKTSNFSLKMKEYNQLYLFSFTNKELVNYGFTHIYDVLSGPNHDKLIWMYQQEIICLSSNEIERSMLAKIVENFSGVICGVSEFSINHYEEDILKKYKQAQRCIQLGVTQNERIVLYERIGFEKYILSLKEDEHPKKSAQTLLKPLFEYDRINSTDLALTLKVYLRNFFSLKKSAEELFIHRNTVSYRLEKIQEIYPDVNFEEHDQYLLFTTSFMLVE